MTCMVVCEADEKGQGISKSAEVLRNQKYHIFSRRCVRFCWNLGDSELFFPLPVMLGFPVTPP